jgi:hypothetical protein
LTIYGLLLEAHLVFEKDQMFEKAHIFGRLGMMIEACVPKEEREGLNLALRAEHENMAVKLLS